jgi:hypothetical protein
MEENNHASTGSATIAPKSEILPLKSEIKKQLLNGINLQVVTEPCRSVDDDSNSLRYFVTLKNIAIHIV